jgi:hypothetical protein
MIQTPKVAHRTVKVRALDIFYREAGPKNAPARHQQPDHALALGYIMTRLGVMWRLRPIGGLPHASHVAGGHHGSALGATTRRGLQPRGAIARIC